MNEVTQLLHGAIQLQDKKAESQLCDIVLPELRKIAYARIRERDSSRQATDLVNDCYLKLMGVQDRTFENRRHFYRYASRVMINLLIDEYRSSRKDRVAQAGTGDDMLDNQVGDPGNLLSHLALSEQVQQVDGAVDGLDDVSREIVIMRTFLDMAWKDIASLQDLSLAACHGKYTKAIESMKAQLHGGHEDDS